MKYFLLFFLSLSGSLLAEVTIYQASELGKSLTPVGADIRANADGTIPEWNDGSTLKELTDVSVVLPDGRLPVNPFSEELPVLTISDENVDRYVDRLSLGQVAMVKSYPDSYKIHVYHTHRSFSNNPVVYRAAKNNALSARLSNGGNGVVGHSIAYPFPILHGTNSEQAMQIIWNHMFRWRNGSVSRHTVQVTPTLEGFYTPVHFFEQFAYREVLTDFNINVDPNSFFYFKQFILSPASMSGNILLVHETVDQLAEPRRAWLYNSSQRRVRRSPTVAYDSPGTASDGLRTNDNFDMFNGSLDKYQWKLIGKREVFIPYNNYELTSPNKTYAQIIGKRHLNPDLLRYELHRVWVVEATLKPGHKHIYSRRVFYVDEDSWQISLVDHYNRNDELWRSSEGFHVQFPRQGVSWLAAQAIYDLFSKRYLVNGLANEEDSAFDWSVAVSSQDFLPASIRREGH